MNRVLGPGVRLRYRRKTGNYLIVEQEPHIQRYFYGGEVFLLPMPWLYYGLAYADEFEGPRLDGPNHLLIVNFLAAPYGVESYRSPMSYLPLPNMYGARPCYHYAGPLNHPGQAAEVQSAITSWWDERGNKDGNLADNITWLDLATRAFQPVSARKKILSYWERMRIEDVQALHWPKACSYREMVHGWQG